MSTIDESCEVFDWKAKEALGYLESKLPEGSKPLSQEAKDYYIKGYTEALIHEDLIIIGFIDEDFTKQGFERRQFPEQKLNEMLNGLTNLYLGTRKTLKRDLAREIIRNEAQNLNIKPKHQA